MITRRDVLSDAVDNCMKELYSFAKPSIEWDKFMEENIKNINNKLENNLILISYLFL